jgi:hypothetical protein
MQECSELPRAEPEAMSTACDSLRQSQGMVSKPKNMSAASPRGWSPRPQAQRASHRGKREAGQAYHSVQDFCAVFSPLFSPIFEHSIKTLFSKTFHVRMEGPPPPQPPSPPQPNIIPFSLPLDCWRKGTIFIFLPCCCCCLSHLFSPSPLASFACQS